MNIYQRINEVRKKVDYAKKDKAVEGYKAVTHDQITALTREHLVAQGVVIIPILAAQKTEATGTQTSRGTPFIRWEGSYRFDVVNADDPTDRFTAEIAAHALDHGDKAPGKALSYAKKALILKLLEIESGDDDEGREEQHKPRNTASQVAKDAFQAMRPERKNVIADTATQIVDCFNEEREFDAFGLYQSITDEEEKLALWSRLDSKQRSAIKKMGQQAQEKH